MDIITVLGPTATGKTGFATKLAKVLDAEIISADSRQVYKGMDIGTGKDLDDYTIGDTKIPYYLIDIVPAGYKYNVYEYQRDFLAAYKDIKHRNRLPILCGGTGMYIDAVLKGYKLIDIPENNELRKDLSNKSQEELTIALTELTPVHNTSDTKDIERTIRAIEIATFHKENPQLDTSFPTIRSLTFGIKLEREIIRERITRRLKERLREGMIDEVELLHTQGLSTEDLKYYGLEYKFIAQYLNKEMSYNAMVKQLNTAIHQFAKRQSTWFRRMEKNGTKIYWIDGNLSDEEKLQAAMQTINREQA